MIPAPATKVTEGCKKGRFITLEGGEGVGKSTQGRLLAAELANRHGVEVVLTREPGGCPLAEKIRELVVTGPPGGLGARAELLLMLAARAEHWRERIRPALDRGAWVVCDRFHDSTLAYQGYGRGLDLDWIRQLGQFVLEGEKPDLTLLLMLPVTTGLERATSGRGTPRGLRFEQESLAFHQRIVAGFATMAEREPERFRVIEATGSVTEVFSRISRVVHDRFWSD
ncbi:MAG: dTMP kinase [Magnetococcales bacterium]|nr:dTMP kinase [Magnetococcales bacterium]MBF0155979.1 dTMP kinase [Magnetococcales bacterium]